MQVLPLPDSRHIKRTISYHCVGYVRNEKGVPTHSIYKSVVEYTDGSRGEIIETMPVLRNTL